DLDPAAVVAELDQHLAADLARGQHHVARPLLADERALLRRLDAVRDRVAQEVEQRVREALHHRLVELRLLAVDAELDLLARAPASPAARRATRAATSGGAPRRGCTRPAPAAVARCACDR